METVAGLTATTTAASLVALRKAGAKAFSAPHTFLPSPSG